jgi:hypothetical protein
MTVHDIDGVNEGEKNQLITVKEEEHPRLETVFSGLS